MKTIEEIQEILNQCEFQDWNFHLEKRDHGVYINPRSGREMEATYDVALQVRFMDIDRDYPHDGPKLQTGRKWFLSRHSTRTEIVQTAWLAVMKAVEHEAREAFFYRGRPIFNTHIDVDTLRDMSGDVDVRTPMEGAS